METAIAPESHYVKQFAVFLLNRAGALLSVVKLLEDASIHVLGLSLQDSVDVTVARLIVSDPESVETIFIERVDAANEREVVHLFRRVRQEFTNLDARRGSGNGAKRAAGGGAGLRIPALKLTQSTGHAHDEQALLPAL